jgi:hypothetical protein
MLPPVTIGFLIAVALLLGYLIGHKKGLKEGIQIAKELGQAPTPKKLYPPPLDLDDDPSDETPSEAITLDNYKVYRGGVIFRGGLEIAIVDDESPFEYERLHDVNELKADQEYCRKLSRLWFEEFGLDAGRVIREGDGYFVSKSGLFWRRDLIFGRMSGAFDGFESFNVSNNYFAKPTPEDLQHCNNLVKLWKDEFR